MTEVLLTAPEGLLHRVKLVALALRALTLLEIPVRTRTLPDVCCEAGITFRAFDPLTTTFEPRPLPRHVAQVWWALEVALRWWPFARRRQCLRRALALGRQISYLEPALVLVPVSLDPVEVHAVLVARGNRLDLGAVEQGALRRGLTRRARP